MKTIAFYNVKGGVGKTTSSVNVAYILSAVFKKRVLLVDLDPQSNSTKFFKKYRQTDNTVADVLLGKKKNKEGEEVPFSIDDAVYHTDYEHLDIVPSIITLGRVERELISDTTSVQQLKLRNQLKKIEDNYDYCILDCHPSSESLININGLAAATEVYIPLCCDEYSVDGLDYTLNIVNRIKDFNDNLSVGGIFFVRYEERRKLDKSVYETLSDSVSKLLLPIKIHKSVIAEESTYTHEPIYKYKNKSPVSNDYYNLCDCIVNGVK